uniref:Uncharacterized protein n=1 Tax=Aegilops tauschii subsp. strangulata TaxID=200361 RepID=A0A452Y1K3_AEGTS
MDDKSNVKKEIDGSLAPRPRKGGLKFAPKKPPKKPAKVVPKAEPVEESKDEIIDKELLMKLKTSQVPILVCWPFVVSASFLFNGWLVCFIFCYNCRALIPLEEDLRLRKKKSIHRLHLGKGTLRTQDLFLRGSIRQRQKHQKNMWIHGIIPIATIL